MKKRFGVRRVKKDGELAQAATLPPLEELQRDPERVLAWVDYSTLDADATWFLREALHRKYASPLSSLVYRYLSQILTLSRLCFSLSHSFSPTLPLSLCLSLLSLSLSVSISLSLSLSIFIYIHFLSLASSSSL